jgi:multidrug resistance efflux pump
MQKGDVLFRIDPRPYQYRLDGLQASLREGQSNRDLAKIELERNRKAARTSAVAASDVDTWRARYEGALAQIENISSQIDDAKYDLEMTEVRAPADGYVIGLSLRPGQRVTNMPVRSWMAFVVSDATRVLAGIQQYALRHVEPGQQAEVVFKLLPGQTFSATVESIAYLTPEGQLAPSGSVPLAPTGQQPPAPFGVVLKLDEDVPGLHHIPGGAVGSAAVYTKSVTPTHIIRRVMIRMDSFLNYIIPS